MTPNNIVNMAMLKELDIIAVTDHNTAGNLPSIVSIAGRQGLGVLPGLEATTAEEVHVLCYFVELAACMEFSSAIYEHLLPIPNRPDFFGPQYYLDEQDEIVAEEPKLLISSLDLSIDELSLLCSEHGGVCVPAHINRMANSLLNNLGFLPPGVDFAGLEVAKLAPPPPDRVLEGWQVLHSSDAHRLEDIFERDEFSQELETMSVRSLFRWLKEGVHHA